MKRCLNATNLLQYLDHKGLLEYALQSATIYLERIRELVPRRSLTGYPNHCWKEDVDFQVIPSHHTVKGKYGSIKFSFQGVKTNGEQTFKHWIKSKDSLRVVCIPQVFLAGFFKCGSTYLFDQMVSHPSIVAPSFTKEPKWWQETEHFTGRTSQRAFFLVKYLMNYKTLVRKLQSSDKQAPYLLSVDGSPGKMFNWLHFSDSSHKLESKINHCLLPSVIPEILPHSKFIVVMRNPTDMVYSSFWYSCTLYTLYNGRLSESTIVQRGPDIFHNRVFNKITSFKLCIMDFPLAHCVLDHLTQNMYSSELPCGRTRLEMGLYYVHAHKWLSIVPKSRFLFLTLEELSSDTNRTMASVWDFLALPPHEGPFRTKKSSINQQVMFDYRKDPRLAMRADTRELLDDFFAPYNRMLADVLADNKFLWKTT